MTKLAKANENPNDLTQKSGLLPLQGYLSTIVNRTERAKLKLSLCDAMGVYSETSFWRFVVGRTNRPNYAQREAAAEVIRNHSGDARYTGEDLFPEHLYIS